MRIMFTSPGRRVELINIFKKNFKDCYLVGGDYDNTSPANYILDKVYKLPYKIDKKYIDEIFEVCKKESIDILIPLIDYELYYFAKFKEKFKKIGTMVVISDEEFIKLSLSKIETYKSMKDMNILVPKTCLLNEFNPNLFNSNYIILKPNQGSASKGIYKIRKNNLKLFIDAIEIDRKKYIVQEYIDSDIEITVDIYVDRKGNLIELCQRQRLKVRAGEVERAKTVKHHRLTSIVKNIVEHLKPFGVINIQFMYSTNLDSYYLIEINPRFGGGYPLSYEAGANFTEHITNDKLYKKQNKYLDQRYITDYFILRFDNAAYMKGSNLLW